MENEKTYIDKLLAEKLQELMPNEEAPEELKKEVFRTLELFDMFGEVIELFTTKFGATEANFLDYINEAPPEEQ